MTMREKANEILDQTADDARAFEKLINWLSSTYGINGADALDTAAQLLDEAPLMVTA